MALTKISQAGAKDEAINEAKLQISNAGTNGQYLQKQSGNTGGLTWATPSTISFSNDADDRVVTGTGSGLNGEANLTFDGTTLDVNKTGGANITVGSGGSNVDAKWTTGATGTTWGTTTNDWTAIMSNNTARIHVANDGKVGIGTTPEEIFHIKGDSETVSSRDGVFLQHNTDSDAADTGLPLTWSGRISSSLANYGLASICGRKENSTGGDGASYLQLATCNSSGSLAERVRIDSKGRLLVGLTTAMSTGSNDKRDTIQAAHTTGAQLLLARDDQVTNSTNRLGEVAVLGNDSDGTFKLCGSIRFEAELPHDTNDKPTAILFKTCADNSTTLTERARIRAGGGLCFNGDTAAANALDDYEEGTWTPSDASTGSLSLTNNSTAYYTKIGRTVFYTFDITYPTNSNGDLVRVTIPLTSIQYGGGWIGWTDLGRPLQVHTSSTSAYFMDNNSGTGNGKHLLNSELSGKRVIGGFWIMV